MTIDAIKSAIAGAIQAESGLAPVWEYEYPTPPAAPYISLNMTGVKRPQADSKTHSGAGILKIAGHRDITIEVRCFGAARLQYLADLMIKLSKPAALDALAAPGLALSGIAEILDITGKLEDQSVPCARMDIFLRTHDELTIQPETGGYIETVSAEGDITD